MYKITVKIYCLLSAKMAISETKLAVCSPQVPGESRQKDLLKYLGESFGNCNWPVIVTSAGSFDFHFNSGMITTCIRVLGNLPSYAAAVMLTGIFTSKHTTGKEY